MKFGLSLLSCTLLTICFVTLRALNKIDWSSWLVFIPLWGPIICGVVAMLICISLYTFGVRVSILSSIYKWIDKNLT